MIDIQRHPNGLLVTIQGRATFTLIKSDGTWLLNRVTPLAHHMLARKTAYDLFRDAIRPLLFDKRLLQPNLNLPLPKHLVSFLLHAEKIQRTTGALKVWERAR